MVNCKQFGLTKITKTSDGQIVNFEFGSNIEYLFIAIFQTVRVRIVAPRSKAAGSNIE